jgi:periplasmic copper chaperone A
MQRVIAATLAVAACVFASAGHAHDYQVADLAIGHPYARATPPGAPVGGAYLTLDNKGARADRLVRASSPAADAVELHTMVMDGGVMRMHAVPGIDIAPGQHVELKPGGLHLMMVGLKQPLVAGAHVPLRLTFEHAGGIDVELAVEPMTGGAMNMPHAN